MLFLGDLIKVPIVFTKVFRYVYCDSELHDCTIMDFAVKERNVVILGKVGSGKKTLGNHICGANIFRHEQGVLGAGNVGVHYGERTKGDTLYRIQIVDTESLQTGYNDPIPHIRKRFTTVHLIIFVIPHGRYTDESHASLLHAVESLNKRARSVSALVITHCEGMTDVQRRSITTEFRNNARSSQVVNFMEKGTYAVGFPDISTLPPHVKSVLQNEIAVDATKITQLVENCYNSLGIEELVRQASKQPFQRSSATAAMQLKTTDKYREVTAGKPREDMSMFSQPSQLQSSPRFQRDSQPMMPVCQEDQLIDLHEDDSAINTPSTLSPNPLKIQSSPRFQRDSQPMMPVCQEVNLIDLHEGHSTINTPSTLCTKSVLILGKVGSGKKTLGNHIAGEVILRNTTTTSSMASVTRDVGMFVGTFKERDTIYRILTCDTESLRTGYSNPLPYIVEHFQNIDLIIFVIANGRYTDESHGSLLHVVKNLHHRATLISALVITHCDGIKAEERQDIISQFRADDRCAPLAAFMGKGIYAVGFPDTSPFAPIGVKQAMEKLIAEDENTVRNLVRECKFSVPVQHLAVSVQSEHTYKRSKISPELQCRSQ